MTDATESKLKDTGLLLLRLVLGGMFVFVHGWPKISAPHEWAKNGAAMATLGITFLPAFWGFMSAFAEFVGGLCIALGLLTRPMAALLTVNLIVAATMHLHNGQGVAVASHAIEDGAATLALVFTGAGAVSLDALVFRGKKR